MTFYFEKTETERYLAKIDLARSLEHLWLPGVAYTSGDYARPQIPNGYEYEVTTGGQSGVREPRWPRTVGNTVVDGSVTWTARAFSTNASDTILSVNLESPTGITVGTASVDGTVISFLVSGGTDKSCYTISVEAATVAGETIEEKVEVSIDGD